MSEKYIVLYASNATLTFGPRDLTRSRVKVGITTENTDAEGIARLVNRNKEIYATAPAIPTCLINPVQMPGVEPADSQKFTWGIKAIGAHTSPFTGKGIKVAVLDTGIDLNHPAFAPIKDNIEQEDFTGEGNSDDVGHGTHVAGTLFGRDVNGVRIGVAPGVSDVYIGKVLGRNGGDSMMIVNGINSAVRKGANIVSMSLGIDFPGVIKFWIDRGMDARVASARALDAYRKNISLFEKLVHLIRVQSENEFSQPVMIIAAAGNESEKPAIDIGVSPPAVVDGIVSVGALGKKNGSGFFIGRFSNSGPAISAPGVDILSAEAGSDRLVSLHGTSMAAPHVAGTAALWMEKMKQEGSIKIKDVESDILHHCTRNGLEAENPVDIGKGMIQAPQS